MGDLQPVLEAILKGAKARETEIGDDLKRRINIMNAEFDKEKETARKCFEKELDKETEKVYESGRSRDRQMIKNAEIRAKTDFVKEVINCAKKRISGLGDKEYSDFLKYLYKNCAEVQNGTIYLNEHDKKRVLKGTFGGAKVADETILVDGGFIAVCENVSYDCTLESIFEEKYNEICDKINALCGKAQQ